MSLIGRAQILAMIPHAGAMCLLDDVLHWDADSVRCLSRCYRNADNPMRRADGILGTASGVEIAAQAMAVHGRLSSGADGPPAQGFLVSLRDVQLYSRYLDSIDDELVIDAERLLGDASGATYRFTVSARDTVLLSGRATVLLRPGA